MELPVHFAQAAPGDVRVDLRCADIRVAEEFLDYAQIGAVFQQVRGEAVPQHVRGYVAGDAGALCPSLHSKPKCDR